MHMAKTAAAANGVTHDKLVQYVYGLVSKLHISTSSVGIVLSKRVLNQWS